MKEEGPTAPFKGKLLAAGAKLGITGNNSTHHIIQLASIVEKLCSFAQGLVPGLHRQFLFTGIRLGLYESSGMQSQVCLVTIFTTSFHM